MRSRSGTGSWEATPLTFAPDLLTWIVEVKPNEGVEGNIELSLLPAATITNDAGRPLTLGTVTAAPEVKVDTLGPVSPTVTLGPDVSGEVTRAEAAHENGVVTITAETGTSVEVTFTKDGSEVFTKTVTGAGSTPVAVVLSEDNAIALGYGEVEVSAVATDAVGNESNAGEFTFTMQLPNYAPVFDTTGLVAYWKMDGTGTEAVAVDSGPNELDASLESGVTDRHIGATLRSAYWSQSMIAVMEPTRDRHIGASAGSP